MGGLNKQGEEKNRVPDTAHDCPILRIGVMLSLIHISEPTRRTPISYAVFCLKKKKNKQTVYCNKILNVRHIRPKDITNNNHDI